MAPFGALWLYFAHVNGVTDFTGIPAGAFGTNWQTDAMLIATGIFTGIPIVLYTIAIRQLGLSVSGIMFYLNPSLQLFVSVIFLNEMLLTPHYLALPIIWLALFIFSFTLFQKPQPTDPE